MSLNGQGLMSGNVSTNQTRQSGHKNYVDVCVGSELTHWFNKVIPTSHVRGGRLLADFRNKLTSNELLVGAKCISLRSTVYGGICSVWIKCI